MKKYVFIALGAVLVGGLYLREINSSGVNKDTRFYLKSGEALFEVEQKEIPNIDVIIKDRSEDFFQKGPNEFVIRLDEEEYPAIKKIFQERLFKKRVELKQKEGDFTLKYKGEKITISSEGIKLSQFLKDQSFFSCEDEEEDCEFTFGEMEKVLSEKGIKPKHIKIFVDLAEASGKDDKVYKTLRTLAKDSLFLLIQLADALGATKFVDAQGNVQFDPERDLLSELLDELIEKVEEEDFKAFFEGKENVLSKVLRVSPDVVFLLKAKTPNFYRVISLDYRRPSSLLLMGKDLYLCLLNFTSRSLDLSKVDLKTGKVFEENDCIGVFMKEIQSTFDLDPAKEGVDIEYISDIRPCGFKTGEIFGALRIGSNWPKVFLPNDRLILLSSTLAESYLIDIKKNKKKELNLKGLDLSRLGKYLASIEGRTIRIVDFKNKFKEVKTFEIDNFFDRIALLPNKRVAYAYSERQGFVIFDWEEEKEFRPKGWEEGWLCKSLIWLPDQKKLAVLIVDEDGKYKLVIFDVDKMYRWGDFIEKITKE